jgi:predicted XRE-type DNA-binding protein
MPQAVEPRPEMAEYVEALETAAPAWFTPTSMDEFKRYLSVLLREHVRACYRSQFEAAKALKTTQGRISMVVTGNVLGMHADSLLRMAFAAGLIKRVEVEVE